MPNLLPNLFVQFQSYFKLSHFEIWTYLLILIGRLIRVMSFNVQFNLILIQMTEFQALIRSILDLRVHLADGPGSFKRLISHVSNFDEQLLGQLNLDRLGEELLDRLDWVFTILFENSYDLDVLISNGKLFDLDSMIREL